MRKNMTEIVFILDRSGSMSGLETDTIGGFNSMIEKQKKENGEALISTVLFDNVSEVIHDRVPVQKVEPMTDGDYSVRGCTALLDAIGGAIHHIGNKPLFIGLTELILLADPDALKDLLHLFLGGGQLHPLTDQHTLVVLAKVRDEGFKITV